MRTRNQGIFGELESRDCLLATHRRKILEELAKGLSGFEVVEQGLQRHSRSDEDHRSAHDLGFVYLVVSIAIGPGRQGQHLQLYRSANACVRAIARSRLMSGRISPTCFSFMRRKIVSTVGSSRRSRIGAAASGFIVP